MPPNQNRLSQIAQLIIKHFNLDEFKDLCLRLKVDYHHLAGDALPGRIQELVLLMERQGRIDELLYHCSYLRPNATWPITLVSPPPPPPDIHPERNPRLIFLSHASQDTPFAKRLATDLRARGWEVWIAFDKLRPGEEWAEKINHGLAESTIFLVVLSPHAAASPWVKIETNAAINLERQHALRFIPLDFAPIPNIPPLWQAYQWISFRQGYDKGLQSLWQALGEETAVAPAPREPWLNKLLPLLRRVPPAGYGVAGILLLLFLLWQAGFGLNTATPTTTPPAIAQATDTKPATAVTAQPTAVEETPTPTLGDQRTRPADGMVMVYVPAGTFNMGSDPAQDKGAELDEQPQHAVTLTAFWLDRTEVTNALYAQCVSTGQCNASLYANDTNYNGANLPVVGVSWNDATAYCTWAGAQLPTEAQWEYAARGTDGRLYPWGNTAPTCDLAQFRDCNGKTVTVGSFSPAGDNWVGAADMAGNVWEWAQDWYNEDTYADSSTTNPSGPESGQYKALRGGGWPLNAIILRSAYRNFNSPDNRDISIGFRCSGS